MGGIKLKKILVLLVLISVFLIGGCGNNTTEKGRDTEESKVTKVEKKNKKKLIKVYLEEYTYNKKDKTVDMSIKTDDIKDGTVVRGKIETGEDGKTDFIFTGDKELKNGKADIKVKADDEDEFMASTIIPNGTFKLSLLVQVDKEDEFNTHLLKEWGDYKKFKKNYKYDGDVQDNSDGDYVVAFEFEDTLDITDSISSQEAKKIDTDLQDKKDKEEEEKEKAEEKRQLSEKKDAYKELDFKQLDKNPDKHEGELVKYSGEIVQIMENDDSTELRLGLGEYNQDVIYVYFNDVTDFVEEDKITVYGEVIGSYTYDTTIGGQVTLPLILADIVE